MMYYVNYVIIASKYLVCFDGVMQRELTLSKLRAMTVEC